MGNLIKTVNIKANIPIKSVSPPIYGVRTEVKMSLNDILKCLCKRAIIDQVLSDGSTVRLNTKNFREDFEAQLQEKLANTTVTKKEVPVDPKKEDLVGVPYTKADKYKENDGSIDHLDIASLVDEDSDDNDGEPEEAGSVVVHRKYVDGTEMDTIGIDPSIKEEDISDVIEEATEEPVEVTEDAEPSINTKTDAVVTRGVQKKNSKKKK